MHTNSRLFGQLFAVAHVQLDQAENVCCAILKGETSLRMIAN